MNRKGPDIICSMDENNAKDLVKQSAEVALMRGGKKEAAKEEKITIDFAFATVCSIENIKKGDYFTVKNIWVKRPGTGNILAEDFNKIIGKTASRDISNDTQLSWEDINL